MIFIPESMIENLVEEDRGPQDMTTELMDIGLREGQIDCYPKRDCLLAGVEIADRIFKYAGAETELLIKSGSSAAAGAVCLRARGRAAELHSVYKAAQNVMEYSSGIATRTAALVRNAKSAAAHVEVAVTRKHFPGAKRISLSAALQGGAQVHRLGLYDSVLIFDQHRVFSGTDESFLASIGSMKRRAPERKLAAESGSRDEALAFVTAGIDVVQCERFDLSELQRTVQEAKRINPGVVISAAGGIKAENAADFAATGVDLLVTSWVFFGKPEDIKMRFVGCPGDRPAH